MTKDLFSVVINTYERSFKCAPKRESILYQLYKLIRELQITTKRNEPKTIRVVVWRYTVEQGSVVKRIWGTYDIPLPFARMTEEEFKIKQRGSLSGVPKEFHSALMYMAWERGHSSGYEEVIGILDELVSSLLPCIQAYRDRLIKELAGK